METRVSEGSADIKRSKNANDDSTIVEFDDNQLLRDLYGEHDAHLARIEQKLSVTIVPRGNRVAITGESENRERAKAVLNDLHDRLKHGLEVSMGEVDGAIRMVQAPWTDERKSGISVADERLHVATRRRRIAPRSPMQARYIEALRDNELVVCQGPAGTGKTYLAVAIAVSMLLEGRVDRLVLSRPAVEAGERLGFLPGDMREKVDPYLRPLFDALYDMLPAERVMKGLETGEIEVAPLAFMRGRTLPNAFIILDEAQNCTTGQMKMFLTRLGEGSHMVVTGDPSQIDLPGHAKSGLVAAGRILKGVKGISMIEFSEVDVVRHPLVTRIVKAYDLDERRKTKRETEEPIDK